VKNNASTHFNSTTDFSIHTVGFELGYQFILWKRVALDFVLAGPGLGFYKYQATFDTNLDPAKQEQLFEALSDMLTDKFPGMNYVFSGEEFNANGVMRTNTIGYRYIVHIGFAF
jgi:hypothetical protein